jgi:hypothetical protein
MDDPGINQINPVEALLSQYHPDDPVKKGLMVHTAKGYLTIPTMHSDIESVLEPDCQSLRAEKGIKNSLSPSPWIISVVITRRKSSDACTPRISARFGCPAFDAFSADFGCRAIQHFQNNLSNYSVAADETETGG